MGNTTSIPSNSPLGHILAAWSTYSYKPMNKKKMIFYCNTTRPVDILESEEEWPLNGSVNCYTTLQFELFCPKSGKWDKISYVQAFMVLYNIDSVQNALCSWRKESQRLRCVRIVGLLRKNKMRNLACYNLWNPCPVNSTGPNHR